MKKHLCLFLLILLAFSCSLVSKDDIHKMDERNSGIDMIVKHKNIFNHSEIVVDLLKAENCSKADVFRCLLQSAKKLENENFKKVELSSKGKSKYFISGEYFKKLGSEYDYQNAAYTIRTFPENLYNIDGTNAFESWSGGWIGVFNQQMNDFNSFMDGWID